MPLSKCFLGSKACTGCQLRIRAAELHKLCMCAALEDTVLADDDDLVCISDRGESVRDDQRRASLRQTKV